MIVEYRIDHLRPRGWHDVPIDFWETEYGFVDYKGKRVMDIGADWGRTADYFLQKGAKEVIAVEGNPVFYRKLEENAKRFLPDMTPILLPIRGQGDFADLIKSWKPDLMQVDCEGCEIFLFRVADWIFSLVPEYLVETHSIALYRTMKTKCRRNGYTIVEDRPESPKLRIIYAIACDRDRYIY